MCRYLASCMQEAWREDAAKPDDLATQTEPSGDARQQQQLTSEEAKEAG